MSRKTGAHRRGKSAGTPESHRCGRNAARKRAAWRFYDGERLFAAFFELHFRMTARAAALDAKHLRSVRLPARASHSFRAL